jgi:hypothetical protein
MNTYGVGWKKHGVDGRFMKKRTFMDLAISFFLGIIVLELLAIFIMRRI